MLETMTEEVKEFLRIDGEEDDVFLSSLISASKEKLKNATGFPVDEEKELHKLAIKISVSQLYEDRLGKEKSSFGLEEIITQMKYCYQGGVV